MNLQPCSKQQEGFNRIELCIVLGVMILLGSIALPMLGVQEVRSARVECLNNLHRIGHAFQAWAADHENKFPWEVNSLDVYEHFLVASNELRTPAHLICPSDNLSRSRSFNDPIFGFNDGNVSYFLGIESAISHPKTWMAGDRSLQIDGIVPNWQVDVAQNTSVAWSAGQHVRAGNLLLADGSVQFTSNRELTNYVHWGIEQSSKNRLRILFPARMW